MLSAPGEHGSGVEPAGRAPVLLQPRSSGCVRATSPPPAKLRLKPPSARAGAFASGGGPRAIGVGRLPSIHEYSVVDRNAFCATVAGLPGVIATGRSLEACRDQLAEVVNSVLVHVSRGLSVPRLGTARVRVKRAS